MFHDESIYPVPHNFDPERFLKDGKLDPSVRNPEDRTFGAGRRWGLCNCAILRYLNLSFERICPGRFFALRTIFLNVACTLTLFDIGAPINEKLEANFTEELISRYVTIPPCLFCNPGCLVSQCLWALLLICLKETGPIQVHDKTSF